MSKKEVQKIKAFATIIYEDSVNLEELKEKLEETHLKAYLSPIHFLDVKENGEPKKPHYHLMIIFDGPTTENKGRKVIEYLGGVGCEKILSIRGYARYLCHLDCKNKPIYDFEKVQEFNGAEEYSTWLNDTNSEGTVITMMLNFIEEYDVLSFREFLIYCSIHKEKVWYPILRKNTFLIKEYLKSRKWDKTNTHISRLHKEFFEKIDKN